MALNLPFLISELRQLLLENSSDQLDRFNDLLINFGYIDSDVYLEYCYILTDEKVFEVVEGFPRICSKQIHKSIINISYSIKLSACKPFICSPPWKEIKS